MAFFDNLLGEGGLGTFVSSIEPIVKTGKEIFDLIQGDQFETPTVDRADFALDPRDFSLDEDQFDTTLFRQEAEYNIELLRANTANDLAELEIAQRRLDQGLDIQIMGLETQQESLRIAGANRMATARFNSALNLHAQQRADRQNARLLSRAIGQQRAAASATGAQPFSRSFLEIQNETYDIFDEQARNSLEETKEVNAALTQEARLDAINKENEARALDFQKDVARYLVLEQQLDNENTFAQAQSDLENQFRQMRQNIDLVQYQADKARRDTILRLQEDRELAAEQAGLAFAEAQAQADGGGTDGDGGIFGTIGRVGKILGKAPKIINSVQGIFGGEGGGGIGEALGGLFS